VAITRNSNTIHAASGNTGSSAIKNLKVKYVWALAQGANSVLKVQDVTTNAIKVDIEIAADNGNVFLDYSRDPMVFPNGINIATNTTMIVVLSVEETQS